MWWNRELTLKCKLNCYVKPMEDPLGVIPSKGNQGTTLGEEKICFDLSGNRTHDLRIRSTVTLCRLSYEVGQRKSGTI